MNLTDPSAARALRTRAPRTYAWLCAVRDGRHGNARGDLALDARLGPLVRAILDVFPPLMAANARAHDEAVRQGQRVFNEAAFDRGVALYEGGLLGQPFRSVVKTFQVRVWRDVVAAWASLPEPARRSITALAGNGLDERSIFLPHPRALC